MMVVYALLGHKFAGDNGLGMEVACTRSVTENETYRSPVY
jgi:hypothetical protein